MKKNIIFCVLLGLTVFLPVSERIAATTEKAVDSCPKVHIWCANDFCNGETFKVSSGSQGGTFKEDPIFKWRISGGKIIKGKGQGEIEVNAEKARGPIKITLEIPNFIIPVGCSKKATLTLNRPVKVDSNKSQQ